MRKCEQCGSELTKANQRRFCGRPCFYESMKVLERRTCKTCGKEFLRRPWETRRGEHTGEYCSLQCYHQSRIGFVWPGQRVEPEEPMCPACGKPFLTGGRGRPGAMQVYCSNECKYRGRYRRGAVANQLSPTDAAYIAGFIDGEGSIMLFRRKDYGTIRPRMSITSTDRGVLDWLCRAVGVSNVQAHRKETATHKACWMWTLNSDGVASLLTQIRSYLKVKVVQADLAIEAMERLRDPVFKADRTWQAEWKERMHQLNRRGPESLAARAGG